MSGKDKLPFIREAGDGSFFRFTASGVESKSAEGTEWQLLSNFCLLVTDFFLLHEGNGTVGTALFRLSIIRGSEMAVLPEAFTVRTLHSWRKTLPDPRLKVFSACKATLKIVESVRIQLGNPRKIFAVSHDGWSRVGSRWIYILGNQAYLPQDLDFDAIHWCGTGSLQPRIDCDPSTEKIQEATAWFLIRAHSIPHVTAPLCLFLILSLQYSRLSQLGMPPQFWLWVTGRSGCGKTSICEQTLCFLPDTERNAFTIGLTGTCAGISDALDMRYDLPILLDDFSTSEGARQQRAYSDLIDQIMRPSTNGVGRRSQNGVRKAHSLAIVTAEKPLRSYSLASRSLCIFVPTSVDFSLFDVGQGDSELLSVFVDHFLAWVVKNPDIFARLEEKKRWVLTPGDDRSFEDARLTSHTRFLYVAMAMFLEYMGAVGLPDRHIEKAADFFSAEIHFLGRTHEAFLHELRQTETIGKDDGWITSLCRFLLDQTRLTVGENANSLKAEDIDACWHKGNLVVKPKAVFRFLQHMFPESRWNEQTVYPKLRDGGIIVVGRDGKSTTVIGKSGRQLVFRADKLSMAAADYHGSP